MRAPPRRRPRARDERVEVDSASRRHAGPRGGAGARSRAISGCAWEKTGGRASAAAVIGGRKKHQYLRAARGSSAPEVDARVGLAKKPSRRASRGSEETERGRDAPGRAVGGVATRGGVGEPRDALAGGWARRGRWTHPRGEHACRRGEPRAVLGGVRHVVRVRRRAVTRIARYPRRLRGRVRAAPRAPGRAPSARGAARRAPARGPLDLRTGSTGVGGPHRARRRARTSGEVDVGDG